MSARLRRLARVRKIQHARKYGRTLTLPPPSGSKAYRIHNSGSVDLVLVGTKGPHVLAPGQSVDVECRFDAPPRVRS